MALLTDFYELTMMRTVLERAVKPAVCFEYFFRELPPHNALPSLPV